MIPYFWLGAEAEDHRVVASCIAHEGSRLVRQLAEVTGVTLGQLGFRHHTGGLVSVDPRLRVSEVPAILSSEHVIPKSLRHRWFFLEENN